MTLLMSATAIAYLPYTDLLISGRGFPLEVTRNYNSRSQKNGVFGFGWSFSYGIRVIKNNKIISIKESDGSKSSYTLSQEKSQKSGGEIAYLPLRGNIKVVEKYDHSFVRIFGNGSKEYFDNTGKLVKKVDANGNNLKIVYNSKQAIDYVEDSSGRRLVFKYNNKGKILSIQDPIGRIYQYNYDPEGNLVEVISPTGLKTQFSYDLYHNLTKLNYPDGNHTNFFYDHEKDLILKEVGPGKKITTYQYTIKNRNATDFTTVVTDSEGNKTKYNYQIKNNSITLNIIDHERE